MPEHHHGQAPTVVESVRVVLPRALVFIYTVRSKRGIDHVGEDVDSNTIDTMVRTADWIVCELIRVYHSLSLEDAQDIVDFEDLAAGTPEFVGTRRPSLPASSLYLTLTD